MTINKQQTSGAPGQFQKESITGKNGGPDQLQTKRTMRFVLADDEPTVIRTNIRTLQSLLSKQKIDAVFEAHSPTAKIKGAENGKLALDLVNAAVARGEKPDLCIFDCDMPQMSGIEVLKILKAQESTKDIPVIVYSADAKMVGDFSARQQLVESLGGIFALKETDVEEKNLDTAIKKVLKS